MEAPKKEPIKAEIERTGLVCDCGKVMYAVGTGAIEDQPNYNKYFEYLECRQCHKLFHL